MLITLHRSMAPHGQPRVRFLSASLPVLGLLLLLGASALRNRVVALTKTVTENRRIIFAIPKRMLSSRSIPSSGSHGHH